MDVAGAIVETTMGWADQDDSASGSLDVTKRGADPNRSSPSRHRHHISAAKGAGPPATAGWLRGEADGRPPGRRINLPRNRRGAGRAGFLAGALRVGAWYV